MRLILVACPSYLGRWQKYLAESYEEHEEQLLYIDVANFADYLIKLLGSNETDEFENIFEVIELLHLRGDDYVKELATIGLLEDIQLSLTTPKERECIYKYLKPESKKWWNNLEDFFSGKTGYVGGPKL